MFDPDEYVFIKNVNITMGLPDTQFVTTNANTGAGSLRWAVEHVSHNGVVRCNLGQQDTIKLTESIEIYSGLTIDGGPNTTPISGNDSCTVFVIDGYDNTPTLQNLLITGGKGIDGGGILCLGYSSLILNHVELSQNLAERGAAICADYPWEYMNWISDIGNMRNMRLRNVLIRDNNASQNGGGVYASNGRLDIETSIIANNQAVQGAGGLSINHCPARIINSLITGNSSMAAGGISSTAYDSVSVINTTIADNHSASNAAGGLDFGYKDDFNGSLIRIENTIFCGNYNTQGPASIGMSTTNPLQATKVNLSHCNFPSGSTIGNLPVTVSSCIYSPPLFDSLSADHPYALLPSSPCIDAGINPVDPDFPATDIVGNKRIFDGDNNGEKVIDIGAYEFDPVWAGMNENPDWVSSFMLVKIYPNPCNVVANLQVKPSERGHIILKLYDINGKELWTRYFDTEPAEVFIRQIDMSSYHPGIYLLEIDNGSEKVLKKLVVY